MGHGSSSWRKPTTPSPVAIARRCRTLVPAVTRRRPRHALPPELLADRPHLTPASCHRAPAAAGRHGCELGSPRPRESPGPRECLGSAARSWTTLPSRSEIGPCAVFPLSNLFSFSRIHLIIQKIEGDCKNHRKRFRAKNFNSIFVGPLMISSTQPTCC